MGKERRVAIAAALDLCRHDRPATASVSLRGDKCRQHDLVCPPAHATGPARLPHSDCSGQRRRRAAHRRWRLEPHVGPDARASSAGNRAATASARFAISGSGSDSASSSSRARSCSARGSTGSSCTRGESRGGARGRNAAARETLDEQRQMIEEQRTVDELATERRRLGVGEAAPAVVGGLDRALLQAEGRRSGCWRRRRWAASNGRGAEQMQRSRTAQGAARWLARRCSEARSRCACASRLEAPQRQGGALQYAAGRRCRG